MVWDSFNPVSDTHKISSPVLQCISSIWQFVLLYNIFYALNQNQSGASKNPLVTSSSAVLQPYGYKTKIRFVSFEPLLADIPSIDLSGLQWVIVGGESDQSAPREFKEEWAIHIRDACKKDKIPFFYKQFGGKRKKYEENLDGTFKKNKVWGTNILDGKKYLEMPIALSTKESSGRAIKVMKDIMDKKQKTLEVS